jgi:uncharacterized protein
MDLLIKSLVGFVVGTLIGMTGVGGGVLLLPILIFGLGVAPLRAVGSDALFNFLTKIGASIVHLRKGTVRRKVVLALAAGSAPGSYLGVSFLIHLRNVYGNGVNRFITIAVGVLLICIPTFLFFQKKIEDRAAVRPPTMKSFAWMSLIGLVAGFPGGYHLGWLRQHCDDDAFVVLQFSAEGYGWHRHRSRSHSHRSN